MKTILLSLTYLVGIGELILAIYFWATNSKSEVRRVLSLLALVTALWCIGSAHIAYTHVNASILLELKIVYVLGLLITTTLVHFIVLFPFPLFRIDRVHRVLAYLPIALFSALILFTNTIVLSYSSSATIPGDTVGGSLFSFYNYLLTGIFLVVVGLLIYRVVKTEGLYRKYNLIFLWSILLGGLPAVINDLIIYTINPANRINTLVVNMATVIWLGAVTYIVQKK